MIEKEEQQLDMMSDLYEYENKERKAFVVLQKIGFDLKYTHGVIVALKNQHTYNEEAINRCIAKVKETGEEISKLMYSSLDSIEELNQYDLKSIIKKYGDMQVVGYLNPYPEVPGTVKMLRSIEGKIYKINGNMNQRIKERLLLMINQLILNINNL